MRLVFWLSLILVAYTFFGYAIILWLRSLLGQLPPLREAITPSVSVVIAARNEQANLSRKLENLWTVDYPKERLEIIVVSDGSTDDTAQILRQHAPRIKAILIGKAAGKANALNEAVSHATGEILVFQDVRQTLEPNAVRELVSCFADQTVGAVSGELLLEEAGGTSSQGGLGIYWKIEKFVRKLESATGSAVGVTGALYAIRRELFMEMPVGIILDDVFIPMCIARAGKRVLFHPSAIARDQIFSAKGKEFSRKVRTLTGNYQLLRLAPWLLTPANPLLFRFLSHKVLRLLAPLLLVVMLAASALSSGPIYKLLFGLQVLFYLLAAGGMTGPALRRLKLVAIANTFVMLNLAAVVAFYNFITGRHEVWYETPRAVSGKVRV